MDIMNSAGMIFGMENLYVHLADETESVKCLLDRRARSQVGIIERALDKCGPYVQFIWTGKDLGTQRAPLISLSMFRSQIRPRHQLLVDLVKSYVKPVMIHCCGSSSWAVEDFIEMGISAVDTLQPEAADMSPSYLSERFGGRFTAAFPRHAWPSSRQNRLIRRSKKTIDIMCRHERYCLAPTHLIQDNTPIENILAMYSAAHRYGVRG